MNQMEMISEAAEYYYYADDVTETQHSALDFQVLLELREQDEVTN